MPRCRIPPTILLHCNASPAAQDAIIEQADVYGWRLLDYSLTRGHIPDAPPPAGAIVSDLPGAPLVERLRDLGIQVVRLGKLPHPQDHEMPAVLPDLVNAGRLAADHFADRQFRHVAFIGHAPWRDHKVTYDVFRAQAARRGCECHLIQLNDPEGPLSSSKVVARDEKMYRDTVNWLTKLPKPVGLFVYTDWMAARVCSWCREAGLVIPEELAILGKDNARFICRIADVPLSSIELDDQEYGARAIRLLKRLIDGETPPAAPVMISPKGVVERQSTNVLAVPDPVVARALRYIWDNFAQPLTVNEIAAEVGVCRRTLERRFRKHLKRSINGELRRKRLERCRELLRTTDYTLAELAPKVGFGSGGYLQTLFTKTFGITPRAYRLQT